MNLKFHTLNVKNAFYNVPINQENTTEGTHWVKECVETSMSKIIWAKPNKEGDVLQDEQRPSHYKIRGKEFIVVEGNEIKNLDMLASAI